MEVENEICRIYLYKSSMRLADFCFCNLKLIYAQRHHWEMCQYQKQINCMRAYQI